MANLLRFDPFFSAFSPLFDAATTTHRPTTRRFSPSFEVRESESSFVLSADLPGVPDESLDISVDGRELTVSGKRGKAELTEGETLHLHERPFGEFARKFSLPDDVDPESIAAVLEHGVLTLTIPKQPQPQPRKIPIRVSAELRNSA